MSTLHLVPSDVARKLARMNASEDLLSSCEELLSIVREQRDGLIGDLVHDSTSVGQRILNRKLINMAIKINDAVERAEAAVQRARKVGK